MLYKFCVPYLCLRYVSLWVVRYSHLVLQFVNLVHLQHGITQTSELVNVTDFFNSHIVPDLQSANGENYSYHGMLLLMKDQCHILASCHQTRIRLKVIGAQYGIFLRWLIFAF